jgi:hypothetical protein
MLNELVVLHELAHCLAPRHAGDVRQLRRGRLVHHRLHWHGPAFTGVLSELVRRFGTGVNHEDLAAAYRHYEVPVMDVEEVFAARAHSDEVEQILAGQFAAADEQAAASEAGPGTRPPARVSSLGWGWWLMEMRRCQRPGALVSRAALAASVSPVKPCTARDIKVLEDAPTLPDSPRLRRIAMTAVAVLDVDPVWARTNLGLVRWDCGVDLEELRTVAEAWVQSCRPSERTCRGTTPKMGRRRRPLSMNRMCHTCGITPAAPGRRRSRAAAVRVARG